MTHTMSLEQVWLEDLVVVGPRSVTRSSSYSTTAVYLLWVLAGAFERLACLASADGVYTARASSLLVAGSGRAPRPGRRDRMSVSAAGA